LIISVRNEETEINKMGVRIHKSGRNFPLYRGAKKVCLKIMRCSFLKIKIRGRNKATWNRNPRRIKYVLYSKYLRKYPIAFTKIIMKRIKLNDDL
jgi:hypothetical protein